MAQKKKKDYWATGQIFKNQLTRTKVFFLGLISYFSLICMKVAWLGSLQYRNRKFILMF